MLTYLGSLTLAVAVPLLGLMDAALLPIIADLQARLAAAIKLSVSIGVQLPGAALTAALSAVAKLSLTPPSLSFAATAAIALVAKLTLQIEALLLLPKWNATAGVHMWSYDGPISGLGTSLAAAPAQSGMPPGTQVYAVILLGGAGATQTALKAVFKTP